MMPALVKDSTLGKGGSAFKVVVRSEGSLDGIANQVWDEMVPRAKMAVNAGADMVLDHMDQLLSRPSPAAPGEPPGELLGELRASLRKLPLRVLRWSVRSGIETRHPGANRLEFGKTDSKGRKTFPHPYVRPTFQALKGRLDRLFEAV